MEAKKTEIEHNYSTLLGNQTIFLITQMHHLITRRTNQELTRLKFPLQVEQLPVLFAVFLGGDNLLSQQEIADVLKRDKSGIQRSIRTLERDGYLRIVADDGDRRRNLIQLTPPGKLAIEQVLQITATIDAGIMDELTTHERDVFTQVARKVINRLNK